SLPSTDVRITTYNQSARQISVEGEANTAALAYKFIKKVKKNYGLKIFNLKMAPPPFFQTTTRSFDWRENHDDASLVRTNESTGACAFMDCCRLALRAFKSLDPELDLWRAGSGPQGASPPQSD